MKKQEKERKNNTFVKKRFCVVMLGLKNVNLDFFLYKHL